MCPEIASHALKHGTALLEPHLRLHYVTAGTGDRVIVLLHGFPQTWRAWSRVIPLLTKAGNRVIALDYRGAGESSRPLAGYNKRTMAADVRTLLKDHLHVDSPITIVGHDIGLMVGYAYAEMFRESVSHLVVVDAPLPGTAVFDRLRKDPRVWHFAFHAARDIPEMLLAGRECQYLQAFFQARMFDPSAIDKDTFDAYVTAYSAPGAMRAGLELYRAFEQDAQENRAALAQNGKLRAPVLAIYGEISNTGSGMREMMMEVAHDVTDLCVSNTAHWVPEENPEEFALSLLTFVFSKH